MSNIQTLKALALGRKMPSVIYLGQAEDNIIDSLLDLSNNIESNLDVSIERRFENPLPRSETDDYSVLNGKYTQKNIDQSVDLGNILNTFEDIHNVRFGVLGVGNSVPFHLDDPFTYRLLVMLQGMHVWQDETQKVTMSEGDIFWVNGCYKHSVHNIGDIDRIALLAKMPITEKNTYELLRTRTQG